MTECLSACVTRSAEQLNMHSYRFCARHGIRNWYSSEDIPMLPIGKGHSSGAADSDWFLVALSAMPSVPSGFSGSSLGLGQSKGRFVLYCGRLQLHPNLHLKLIRYQHVASEGK